MIKRGNLILVVLVGGVLPLVAAIVSNYWLVARTNGEIQARANNAIVDKTRNELSAIAIKKREIVETRLQEIEKRLQQFASRKEVVQASKSILLPKSDTRTATEHFEIQFANDNSVALDQLEAVASERMTDLRLSNIFLCDMADGTVIYSVRDSGNESQDTKINSLHKAFAVGDGLLQEVVALPFNGKVIRQDQVTYVGAPVKFNGKPEALAVFEVSINAIGSLIHDDSEAAQSMLLVNHVSNLHNAIGENDVSSVATIDSKKWNLSVVTKTSQQHALKKMNVASQKAARLTTILYGTSQASVLWTVFFVIASGTLIVNHIKKPLEVSTNELQQISLEGSGLLLDNETNQDRQALLTWVNTVVSRVDKIVGRFASERTQVSELSAIALSKTAIGEEPVQTEKPDERHEPVSESDEALREVIRRSQKSLASATEAARLAEQAISKLGTNISPKEISELQHVVTDITEQSKWLDENSSWMEEPVEYAN